MAEQLNGLAVHIWDDEKFQAAVQIDWDEIGHILASGSPVSLIVLARIVAAAYGQGRIDGMAGHPSRIPSGHEVPALIAKAMMAAQT